ncbi:MAG: phage scaffolding protein [Alphaproteobacteria bacterium]|nr:phage scaffolding protein [Alphaproteobacteria bacterium]
MLEWLKGILGDAYTDDVDSKISAEIGKAFVAKTDFNNVKAELKTAKDTVTERDTQLDTLKKSTGDVEALKQQITDLQTANTQKDATYNAQIAQMKLDGAVDKALSDAKAKNTTAAKALLTTFLKDAKVEEDGTVRGLTDEIKKLSADQASSFLFDSQADGNKGGMAGAAPAGNGGGTGGNGNGSGNGGGTGVTTLSDAVNAALFGNNK